MSEVINLDEMLPKPKKLKIGGVTYKMNPLLVSQFLNVASLERDLMGIDDPKEVIEKINEVLSPILEGFTAEGVSMEQLKALVTYLLNGSIPEDLKKVDTTTQKKTK